MSARPVRRGGLLCCLAALLFGAVSSAAARARSLGEPVTVPIELANNLIFLRASVQGPERSEPGWFVLDTGDKYALVDVALASSVGLELGDAIDVRGSGSGSLPGRFVQQGSFGLVGLPGFTQPLFLALPLDSLARAGGHAFGGILGTDFLEAFVVEIDYAKQVLVLHDREGFQAPKGLASLALSFDSQHHPEVRARIHAHGREALEGVFVLDTGASDVLTLNAPFVAREGLIAAAGPTVLGGTQGAGGVSEDVVGRIEALELGPFRIERPLAVLSSASAGAHASAEVEGDIGGGCLRRFRVFLDYGRERVLLQPNEGLAAPFEHDMSGLRVLAEGDDLRSFRVAGVTESSPASAAGMRTGDVLTVLDGRPAAELTLSEIRELFRREGTRHLTIERDGKRQELTLELRRRI